MENWGEKGGNRGGSKARESEGASDRLHKSQSLFGQFVKEKKGRGLQKRKGSVAERSARVLRQPAEPPKRLQKAPGMIRTPHACSVNSL